MTTATPTRSISYLWFLPILVGLVLAASSLFDSNNDEPQTVVLNGVTSLSYAANMQATRLAKAKGAQEALFVTPGDIVLEAPTSTLFWVSPEGPLRTTSLDAGVLDSITRARILDALDVEEGEWPLADVCAASEAFLASTTREIQPVASVDGTELSAAPGPRAVAAGARNELLHHYVHRHPGRHPPVGVGRVLRLEQCRRDRETARRTAGGVPRVS